LFLNVRKKWWLGLIVIVLGLWSLLFVGTQGSCARSVYLHVLPGQN
jgi:MFS-type transporter involved in bile tolerance (Atg22 family)